MARTPASAPEKAAPPIPTEMNIPPRERYELERDQGGFILIVNGIHAHGPDRLDIVLDKLGQRVFHRHGIIGNGPLPLPGGQRP